MVILVIGGSGSGKSAYAEECITAWYYKQHHKDENKLYYLATMKAYGAEGERKVQRHRKMREGKGFTTIEQTTDIAECLKQMEQADADKFVLLECMSNLVANEMFTEQEMIGEDAVVQKVIRDVSKLCHNIRNLVIVTNNVFEDGCDYDEATRAYIRALGKVNLRLQELADKVVEVVVGIPLDIKG